jgi:hypothetical protein
MGAGRTITVSRCAWQKQLKHAIAASRRIFFMALLFQLVTFGKKR